MSRSQVHIRLTDREIADACRGDALPALSLIDIFDDLRREVKGVARAQLRKVAKWGEEPCPHLDIDIPVKRWHCRDCWADLREEAGLG